MTAIGRGPRLGLGLFVAALPLRPQLVVVAPLFPLMQSEFGSSHAALGALATIPVLCMGIFAPLGGELSRRLGPRRGMLLCLFGLGCSAIIRAVAPDMATLIALTIPIGVAMGAGGVLLPLVVKTSYGEQPGLPTGIYTAGIQLGAAIVAGVAVPIAALTGTWRASLALTGAATVLLAVSWRSLAGVDGGEAVRRPKVELARQPIIWWLALICGLQGLAYYGLSAWLPAVYVERGWTEAEAGLLLSVFNATALATSLIVAALSDRAGSRRAYLLWGGTALTAAVLGLILIPAAAWLWAALAGAALSVLFVMILVLPLDIATDVGEAGPITGTVLGIGYTISATAPFVLGLTRDLTESFTGGLWILAAIAMLVVATAAPLSSARLGPASGMKVKERLARC